MACFNEPILFLSASSEEGGESFFNIYTAPEMNPKLSGYASTECSSDSDCESDEGNSIIDAKFNWSAKKEVQMVVNHNVKKITLNPHKCIKPSLFNPIRKSQRLQACSVHYSLNNQRMHPFLIMEEINENFYKIALMNTALKHPFPAELLTHL